MYIRGDIFINPSYPLYFGIGYKRLEERIKGICSNLFVKSISLQNIDIPKDTLGNVNLEVPTLEQFNNYTNYVEGKLNEIKDLIPESGNGGGNGGGNDNTPGTTIENAYLEKTDSGVSIKIILSDGNNIDIDVTELVDKYNGSNLKLSENYSIPDEYTVPAIGMSVDSAIGNLVKKDSLIEERIEELTKITSLPVSLPYGIITMYSGAVESIPKGWQLCDGTNGTPDLRGRFVVGLDPKQTLEVSSPVTMSVSEDGIDDTEIDNNKIEIVPSFYSLAFIMNMEGEDGGGKCGCSCEWNELE